MKKKKKLKPKTTKAPDMSSGFDVLGSYTGNYLLGEYEDPVQDVDDL